MTSNTVHSEPMTVKQAAKYLGMNEESVRLAANRGTLPHFRVPSPGSRGYGERRFNRADLDAYHAARVMRHFGRLLRRGAPVPSQEDAA